MTSPVVGHAGCGEGEDQYIEVQDGRDFPPQPFSRTPLCPSIFAILIQTMFHFYALKQLRRLIDVHRDDILRLLRVVIAYLVRVGAYLDWPRQQFRNVLFFSTSSDPDYRPHLSSDNYHPGHPRWTARVFLPGRMRGICRWDPCLSRPPSKRECDLSGGGAQ